jgi:hypothetical protein
MVSVIILTFASSGDFGGVPSLRAYYQLSQQHGRWPGAIEKNGKATEA